MPPQSFPTTKIPRPSPLFSGARDALAFPDAANRIVHVWQTRRRIRRGKPRHQSEREKTTVTLTANATPLPNRKPPQCRLEGNISTVPFLINRIEIKISARMLQCVPAEHSASPRCRIRVGLLRR